MTKKEAKKPEDLYSHIEKRVETALSNTAKWSDNQDKFHRLRMRIKKAKNFPFVGCSNIRMPTAETKIRKIKAALINLLFGIRPIVQTIPTPSGNMETAKKIEKFLDHLLMNVAKIKARSIIAVDGALEKGFFIIKPYYRVETTTRLETYRLKDLSIPEVIEFFDPDKKEDDLVELLAQITEADMSDRVRADNEEALREAVKKALSGEEEIKIKLKDVLYDAPDIDIISPENFLAPADGGFDVQKLEWCGQVFYKPLHEIKQNAEEKGWDLKAIEEIEAYKDLDIKRKTDITKDQREGIERLQNPSGLVKLIEMCAWYDLNEDGEPEKCIFTVAPDFKKVLRKISLPYDNGKWPYVKIYTDLTDDRWFSHRGLVELIEDIIKEIDIQHMQKIDQQTIRNTPMFMYRAGMVNPNLVQFIPNQGIPVHGMNPLRDTIDLLNNSNPSVEMSYEREEQILLGRLEELLGVEDYTLQSQINRREPRTFGEVSLQAQSQKQVFSLDASLLIDQFSEFYSMFWDLWCQYGPEKCEFEYFGQGKWESLQVDREEIQGKYRHTVRGNDQNTNPQVRMDKAQMVYQMTQNPIALQMGVITPQNVAAAYKLAFDEMDIPNAEAYYNPQPQPMPAPEAPPLIVPKFSDLEEGEQGQVLQTLGIKPDVEGMRLKRQAELTEIHMQAQKAKGAQDAAKEKGKSAGKPKSSGK